MSLLTRDQIIAADDSKSEDVDVPEWGGTVRLRSLTGTERDAFEASIMQQRGDKLIPKLANARAKLVALSVIDENGSRLFTDAQVKELGSKNAAVLTRVFEKAQKLSGMSDEDIEELAGESSADPLGDSSSD